MMDPEEAVVAMVLDEASHQKGRALTVEEKEHARARIPVLLNEFGAWRLVAMTRKARSLGY